MTVCGRYSLGGSRCELEQGHQGKHSIPWPDGGTFDWDDKSQSELLSRYGGTRGT